MTTDTAAAVVTNYIRAVGDGDLELIRASFADDATWVYPGDLPLSGTWQGRDAIVDDFLGQLGDLLEPGAPLKIELTSTLVAGDQVVAEWTSQVTARGGVPFTNHNIAVFTVRDAKITSVREYTDTQLAARIFG
ncbi:MAG TPA: nuclear transport factor 2 family protein [Streptosporangiaceae bacterium]|nr:nuclear transport factor 2 family protein [Streptosporangiaceae bacterium]